MIDIGKINNLEVIKQEKHGFYLKGDEPFGNILLPNKNAPKNLKINDKLDVFIYFDSEDTIIATSKKPLALVGEFASLKVSSIEDFGVFLDWGLEKELFVPHREQLFKMMPGQSYVVYVYVDSSQRIAASTRIAKFIDKSPPPYREGDQVELLPYQKTDLGVKAIINGSHDGLIFKDDIVHNLKLGQKTQGYIKKIRSDNKVDLGLSFEKDGRRKELAEQILIKLKASGGRLEVNSKSSAEVINAMFKVSRNKFKVALGHLYKKRLISTDETGISLL